MNGIIKNLGEAESPGVIVADDGRMVDFYPVDVLVYDLPALAAGQAVRFDLTPGRRPRALNVVVQHPVSAASPKEKRVEPSHLRYMGFEQSGNVRAYRFERVAPGERKAAFVVYAEIGLFTTHRVGLQAGPVLCLRLLVDELNLAGQALKTSGAYTLTRREMEAYLASRPTPRVRHGSG